MALIRIPQLIPLPLNFLTPILAHRDEPQATAEQHWTFGEKMKPALTGGAAASDLRCYASPRHDQRRTSSCAAQTMIKALELLRIKRWGVSAHVDLSRLATYFLARELMDPPETDRDEGSYISLNAEALRRFGTCAESLWPFDDRLILKSPPWRVMQSAYKNRLAGWTRISSSGNDRVDDVILALANGIPVAFGTKVGTEWFNYTETSAPLGLPTDVKGRHATLLEGWDPAKGVFLGENSWGCYDEWTEILTQEGWRNFADLHGDELFATLNPTTHCLEYQRATKLHEYAYDGDLLHFESQGVDLAVTPNHRMYVTDRHKRHLPNWGIVRADQITGEICFKKDAVNTAPDIATFTVAGEIIDADLWLEFMGYYLSNGCSSSCAAIRTHDKQYEVADNYVRCGTTGQFLPCQDPFPCRTYTEWHYKSSLTQALGTSADKIEICLSKLPFHFQARSIPGTPRCKPRKTWDCTTKSLWEALAKYGKAHERYIPRQLLTLSERQSRILLDALVLGDGSVQHNATYYTSSKQLADDAQELALRCGYAADISLTDRTDKPDYPEYVVSIKVVHTRPEARHEPARKPHKGKVRCVTVPNGLVYVRRNGKATWCGNSVWGKDGFYEIRPEVIAWNESRDFVCVTTEPNQLVNL